MTAALSGRRPSEPRTWDENGARALFVLMACIWLVAFKWSWIFWSIGRHALVTILIRAMVIFLAPMAMLAHAIWYTRDDPSRVIWISIAIFSPTIVWAAFSLHVSCGGWIGSAFLPMWCVVGVLLPTLYDVPGRIRSPLTALTALLHFVDMAVEFKLAEALPAFVAEPMMAMHRGMRLLIPLEPDPSFPPTVYSCMWLNNFFTPTAIVLWVLNRVTSQRREWQKRSDEVLFNLIPEEIADQLRRGVPSSELTRHHHNVTCFFSDIVGFTALSHRTQDPSKVNSNKHYRSQQGDRDQTRRCRVLVYYVPILSFPLRDFLMKPIHNKKSAANVFADPHADLPGDGNAPEHVPRLRLHRGTHRGI